MAKVKKSKVKEFINNHYDSGGYCVHAHPRDFGNEFDILFIGRNDDYDNLTSGYRTVFTLTTPKEAYKFINYWDPDMGGDGYYGCVRDDDFPMNLKDFIEREIK